MQTLSVLGVEDGAIVVTSPAGERFRLPLDAALKARILAEPTAGPERRLSPREIQAHVRGGLSAEQVAAMTGVPVASIERFVGPVLAERAYIVESALAVRLAPETEGARSRTFGAVMGERLDALAAREIRWSSAKEPSGWVLAVRFSADGVAHDARWRFDPKHMRLEPDNVEASTISQQGASAALTPRLRAIEPTAPVPTSPPAAAVRRAPEKAEPARFDSAAFRFDDREVAPPRAGSAKASSTPRVGGGRPTQATEPPATVALPVQDAPVFAPRPAPSPARTAAAVTPLPTRHVAEPPAVERPTEPFRRRRERGGAEETGPAPGGRPRRGRTSMPSWDEIVFGRDET